MANKYIIKKVELYDAEEMHKKYPKTFHLPDKDDLDNLKVGDSVKVNKIPGERFWVEIVDIKPNYYLGRVDNMLVTSYGNIKYNDIIQFRKKNIYAIGYPMLHEIDGINVDDYLIIEIPLDIVDISKDALIVREIKKKQYGINFYAIKNKNEENSNNTKYTISQKYIPIPIKKIPNLEKGETVLIPLKIKVKKKNGHLFIGIIGDLAIGFNRLNISTILDN